jgi:drug/metabolite transporter (DMT)-like permease
MVVTVVLWASAFVGIRAIGPHFSPGPLTLGRLAVAAVVLGFVALPKLTKSRLVPRGREWWPIVAYGVMWFGGYNVALNAAEHVLDAGTSALLINVNPILVAIMAGIFLREGFPRWLLIGSTIAFAGVALIALGSGQPGAHGESPTADVAGVLLCLLAAVLAAVSVIIQKPVLRKFPAAQATWFGIVVGAACCLPFAGQLVSEVQTAPPAASAGLVYLGVFPTAIAFTTWALCAVPGGCGQTGCHNLPGARHHGADFLALAGRNPHHMGPGGRPGLPGGRQPDPPPDAVPRTGRPGLKSEYACKPSPRPSHRSGGPTRTLGLQHVPGRV